MHPKIRVDGDQLTGLEICVVAAPGAAPEPRRIELRHLFDRFG